MVLVSLAGYVGLFYKREPEIRDSTSTSQFDADTWAEGIDLGARPDKMRRVSWGGFNETNLNFYSRTPFKNKEEAEQHLKKLNPIRVNFNKDDLFTRAPKWFPESHNCTKYKAIDRKGKKLMLFTEGSRYLYTYE